MQVSELHPDVSGDAMYAHITRQNHDRVLDCPYGNGDDSESVELTQSSFVLVNFARK